ncbi:MAG: hypothetical protein EXQ98_08500 [Alphaproteobacteria bacterium]|nr:hypothetical protein [Alphaproteobacteria bacterium]
MIRILLTYVVPLLLPAALYIIYVIVARRILTGQSETAAQLRRMPWLWLLAAGVVLMGISLAVLSLTTGGDIDRRYVAPHVEDGKVVPGHLE